MKKLIALAIFCIVMIAHVAVTPQCYDQGIPISCQLLATK